MQRPNRKTLVLALAAALLVAAPSAHAGSRDVIRDCSEDGTLDKRYSQRELSGALDTLPSDLDEYTDCRGVIRRAQLTGTHGKDRRGILGRVDASAPPSSSEAREISEASTSRGPVEIGGKRVRPGDPGTAATPAALGTDLPPLVLAALIGLGVAISAGGAFALERRRPGAWQAAGAGAVKPWRAIGEGVRRGIARLRR
jgi:hypothetical protein